MTKRSGINLEETDPSIPPQDDLFGHVNKKWIESTEIPPDKSSYGTFHILAENAEIALRKVLESLRDTEDPEEIKIRDLYKSFMDESTVESLGSKPIAGFLESIEQVDTIEQFLELLGSLQGQGVSGIFQLFVDPDPGDPNRYLVLIEQSGITLPDERYYREDHFTQVRHSHKEHISKMFALVGLSEPAERAERVAELERKIAASHWDNVSCRDSIKTYNLGSWSEFEANYTKLKDERALDPWLKGFDAHPDSLRELVVRQPSFHIGVARLLSEEALQDWKDWLQWQIVHGAAPYLSSSFVEENFNFYGKTLSGAKELRPRWKRAVAITEGLMGEALGKIYVKEHFSPEAKRQMEKMVDYLLKAYELSIKELAWMSEETKNRALEKLSKFTPKIGYPHKWRDYSKLNIKADDLWGNVMAGAKFTMDREFSKLGKPVDRSEWFMTPQTVNAYYNPSFNEIVFPAAILQFPFYDPERDDAANYGAIGAVIGHEIGHGFDDQGSHFDGDGRLSNWWTDKDREYFDMRAKSLIDQYSSLVPRQLKDHYVNGALTIGENIGDIGGLGIAWKAYQLSRSDAEDQEIDGLSGAQRFFLSWARAWREKQRDEELVRRMATDPHSPAEFRCNQVVRNLDAFYEAFSVTKEDAMWMDPTKRVTIW
jgi:putative endopeptidase